MKTFLTVFLLEIRSFWRWAMTRKVAMAAIVGSMLVIVVGITRGMYAVSSLFFRNLSAFDNYGDLTAFYIVAAAASVTIWFIQFSSAVTLTGGNGFLDSHQRYALTLPVKLISVAGAVFIRVLVVSLSVAGIVFVPVLIAYMNVSQRSGGETIFTAFFAVAAVVIIGESLGLLTGMLLESLVRKLDRFGLPFLLIFFLTSTFFLLRLVFPQELSLLFDADLPEFNRLFYGLPLLKYSLPPSWIAALITGLPGTFLLPLAATSAALFAGSFLILVGFIPRLVYGHERRRFISGAIRISLHEKYPLTKKDLVTYLRSPEESGYAVFLSSIALFFFAMVWVFENRNAGIGKYLPAFSAFSVAWILFFAMSFFIRSVFPLMAREGREYWHLFTMPLSRTAILAGKFRSALILMFIWLAGSLLLLTVVFGQQEIFIPITLLTLTAIPSLSVIMVSLGAVHPNFSEAGNSERLSTTGMGLIATFAGLATVASATIAVYRYTAFPAPDGDPVTLGAFLVIIMAPLVSYLLARQAVLRYTF